MHATRSQRILFVLIAVASHWLSSSHAAARDDAIIKPNRDLQNKIEDLTTAVEKAGEPGGGEQVLQAILALDRAAGKDKEDRVELVRQLIWHHSRATGVADGMTLSVALRFIEVSTGSMVVAIAPVFGVTNDARIEQACNEVAGAIEDYDQARGYDFGPYKGYIRGKLAWNRQVEPGLAEHMFRRSPGQALQTFAMVVYQGGLRKPFLRARHVVDDALWKRQHGFAPPKEPDVAVTEQLAKMAGRDEWWARLYAAEIVRQHPEFGTGELVKRLSDDPHPLVQKTAKQIKLPKRQPQEQQRQAGIGARGQRQGPGSRRARAASWRSYAKRLGIERPRRMGQSDSPVFLPEHRKIGTVPDVLSPASRAAIG